jgi:single-strand DNA-binding protein
VGKLRYSSWERDGQKRSKIEVVVDDLDFMTPKQDGQQAPQQHQPTQPTPAPRPAATTDVYDEDIPF